VSGNTPAERLGSFSKRLSGLKIDSVVISDPRHIFYFTGFSTYKSRINSILLVDPRNEEHVLLVGRSEESAAREAFSGKLEIYQDYDIKKRMIVYPDTFSGSSAIYCETSGPRKLSESKSGTFLRYTWHP
jgi:Xaa-Pro aminopeptidase